MIGRTALALLIDSKRDVVDPRVLPFYWGDDSGWARQSFAPAPQPGRLSLPSVRSNALAVGSFASQGPPSSYGETSARLLAKKRKTRADREMETVRRAQTWFAPHLVGNPCGNTSTCAIRHATMYVSVENSPRADDASKNQPNRRRCDRARDFASNPAHRLISTQVGNPAARQKPYRWPGSPNRGAAVSRSLGLAASTQSLEDPSRRSRESAPGTVASSTVASRARSVPGALFLDDDDDDLLTEPAGSVRFSDDARLGPPKPPSAADLRALARIKTPSEDLALLAASLLVLVHGDGGMPEDVKWPHFVRRAKDGDDLKAAARDVGVIEDFKRRALHSFLDGRLKTSVAPFSKRQGRAVRTLEAWVRSALKEADDRAGGF